MSRKTGLYLIIILLFVWLYGAFLREDMKSNPKKYRTQLIEKKETLNSPMIGEQGYLYSGTELVGLAVDKNSIDEWSSTLLANDKIGATELLLSGRIFFVPAGTRVLRLDSGWSLSLRKVRILEGEYLGQVGWLPYEWLKKNKEPGGQSQNLRAPEEDLVIIFQSLS